MSVSNFMRNHGRRDPSKKDGRGRCESSLGNTHDRVTWRTRWPRKFCQILLTAKRTEEEGVTKESRCRREVVSRCNVFLASSLSGEKMLRFLHFGHLLLGFARKK